MTPQPPNPSPLQTLLADHLNLVYSAALRQTRNPHLAEDITQSVFLIAARKHRSIPQNHAAAWLIKVTRYVTLATGRAHRRRTLHESRFITENPPMNTTPTLDPALAANLDAALSSLSQSDRELLIRRYFQNLPITSIAASLHLTENTVSKRLERAIQKLRRRLAHRGITTPTALLTTSLLATANHPAPNSLAAHILTNSSLPISTPIGVLLMSPLIKTLATTSLLLATAVALFASTYTAAPLPPPNASTSQPSPDEKKQAFDALAQCTKTIALLNTSTFSYDILIEQSLPDHPEREAELTTGKVLRDAPHAAWFAAFSDWIGPKNTAPADRLPQQTLAFSLLNGLPLSYQSSIPPAPQPFSVAIWPKTNVNLRVKGTLSAAIILEGYNIDDAPHDTSEPTSYFDIIKSEFSSLTPEKDPAGNPLLHLTSHGPHGQYDLTLDPTHNLLPLRLEITKTADDLLHGQPLQTITGNSQNGYFPNALFTKAHLLLDHIHFTTFKEGPVIDAAEISMDYTFADDQIKTIHITLHRTDIHLNPPFNPADFTLTAPNGTPVEVLNRTQGFYPKLEWQNGKILRTSDHQSPTPEEILAPDQPTHLRRR